MFGRDMVRLAGTNLVKPVQSLLEGLNMMDMGATALLYTESPQDVI